MISMTLCSNGKPFINRSSPVVLIKSDLERLLKTSYVGLNGLVIAVIQEYQKYLIYICLATASS